MTNRLLMLTLGISVVLASLLALVGGIASRGIDRLEAVPDQCEFQVFNELAPLLGVPQEGSVVIGANTYNEIYTAGMVLCGSSQAVEDDQPGDPRDAAFRRCVDRTAGPLRKLFWAMSLQERSRWLRQFAVSNDEGLPPEVAICFQAWSNPRSE
jgi:hypothetical protein